MIGKRSKSGEVFSLERHLERGNAFFTFHFLWITILSPSNIVEMEIVPWRNSPRSLNELEETGHWRKEKTASRYSCAGIDRFSFAMRSRRKRKSQSQTIFLEAHDEIASLERAATMS